MTRIIMTEVTSPYGKYTKFTNKKTGKDIGEVDWSNGRYKIFYNGNGRPLSEIGTKSKKQSAIQYLQDAIKAGIRGEVEFKFNVMSERVRLA